MEILIDTLTLARSLPKIDLHCHFTGAIDRETALGLVRNNPSGITTDQVRAAYELGDLDRDAREPAFYDALDIIGLLLNTPGDLEAAVYGLVSHGVRTNNLRYLELSVNPTQLMRTGMSFTEVRDGLVAGTRAAQQDFGITTNLIAAIMRDEPVSSAQELLDNLIEHRTDEFVGIGLDGPESEDHHRPIHFAEVYRQAKRNGFMRTAHYCQFGASQFQIYTDDLECDRIDHGYPVVEDSDVLRRAVDSRLPFTVCPTITMQLAPASLPEYQSGLTHPLRTMHNSGVWIVPGTDDGAMVATDITTEYAVTADWCGWGADDLAEAVLANVDATWLDASDKAALRGRMRVEIDDLAIGSTVVA